MLDQTGLPFRAGASLQNIVRALLSALPNAGQRVLPSNHSGLVVVVRGMLLEPNDVYVVRVILHAEVRG